MSTTTTTTTTKREYALLELLASERTYASDLTLICDYQIPLASGRLSSISSVFPAVETTISQYRGLGSSTLNSSSPADIPSLAGPSTVSPGRPQTIASETSEISLSSIFTLRPMKTKDVEIVFSNIDQLAELSDDFLYQMESALGELIMGNEGEDHVGKLFIEFMPKMEPLYRTYVMNQAHALERYHLLSGTFQFDVYLPQSRILAHKSSNAWDLPSLLIKPVQRLLHYPQLLAAIIAETPDSHGDKANLVEAHARMEAVTRDLNARWIQQRVVQEVLAQAGTGSVNTSLMGTGDGTKAKRSHSLKFKVSLISPVTLGRRMKNFRPGSFKTIEGPPAETAEAETVQAMSMRLKRYGPVMLQFTREMIDWADAMCNVVCALEEWAKSFARVIWEPDHEEEISETFQVFLAIISDKWLVACNQLKDKINEDVLRTVASLTDSMVAPMLLLEAMQSVEPTHSATKSRPPPSIPAASQSYAALCAQLFAELPTFFTLLDKGIAVCILKWAHIQCQFYHNALDLWRTMWYGLKEDGETNGGAEETLRVWWNRFSEVYNDLTNLNITRRLEKKHKAARSRIIPGRKSKDVVLPGPKPDPLLPLPIPAPHPGSLESPFVVSPASASTTSISSSLKSWMGRRGRSLSRGKPESEESLLYSRRSSMSSMSGRSSSCPTESSRPAKLLFPSNKSGYATFSRTRSKSSCSGGGTSSGMLTMSARPLPPSPGPSRSSSRISFDRIRRENGGQGPLVSMNRLPTASSSPGLQAVMQMQEGHSLLLGLLATL
ncbi:hypothetical protein GSI_03658 [Ganoderma sinense ZZ0214-1]|uniref:DH domain-containing protein n=1 Tax=Ganoderma sinense ZZ0214-1 TaxID=1077348 RepID=A0A2G8SJL8_9APHY|nr:hypothetical protein GSI_03658 [Ganoderma sinense ZZ0214-1]